MRDAIEILEETFCVLQAMLDEDGDLTSPGFDEIIRVQKFIAFTILRKKAKVATPE